MPELTPKQQVAEILKNNKSFLIFTHQNPDGDAIGSAVALSLVLKRLGKNAEIFCNDIIPNNFNYLAETKNIKTDFTPRKNFIISVDVSKTKAEKVMYKVEDGKLNIFVSPANGEFNQEMVSFPEGKYKFDAVIILDSPDMERVGKYYDENTEIFYETPVINIDHHPGNDYFGKINLVDLTATSTSEILVSVIEALTGDSKFFDEQISTALLTGIITDTNSFQNTNTTPKSLTVAAQLVASGAKQQEIIKKIYKTKPLSTLRLWGRALSSLKDEKAHNFVWSAITKNDFVETKASIDESGGLIDELLKTASGMDFALLLSEKNGDVHGSLRSTRREINVVKIAEIFNGGGHTMAAAFKLEKTNLQESAKTIVEKIKKYQSENPDKKVEA